MRTLPLFFFLLVSLGTREAIGSIETPTPFRDNPDSMFSLRRDTDRPRDYMLTPFVSFLLPGFDQWWEGQYSAAAIYSGTAIAGLTYAGLQANHKDDRHALIGSQFYMGAGGFSAYHSFRSAVRSRQPLGQFTFLTEEETASELLLAPFEFSHLQRWTTIAPLLFVSAFLGLAVAVDDSREVHISPADVFFAGGHSYLAGTWEEAAFRGYLYPALTEATHSSFWGNIGQSAMFTLGHPPYTALGVAMRSAFGLYTGWLVEKRAWTLSEAIFIHTWWDVLVFGTVFALTDTSDGYNFKVQLLETRF
jgi:hypothetical protein